LFFNKFIFLTSGKIIKKSDRCQEEKSEIFINNLMFYLLDAAIFDICATNDKHDP